MVIWGYLITFVWVFAVMGIAQIAKKLFKASGETSRKLVHVLVAFAWIPMYFFFGSSWHLLVPPLCFVVINYISLKKNVFSMMEREGEVDKSFGTVFYALAMTIMAGLSVFKPDFLPCYGIGMFCMAFGDGLAPIIGSIKKGNTSFFGGKRTVWGSCTVLVFSVIVVLVMAKCLALPFDWYDYILIGLCATLMEIAGMNGFDNLTLPLGASAMSYLLLTI